MSFTPDLSIIPIVHSNRTHFSVSLLWEKKKKKAHVVSDAIGIYAIMYFKFTCPHQVVKVFFRYILHS